MKSRQFIWLLLFSTALNLNCLALSNSLDESNTLKKVFILIRSEENQNQLEKFKQQINYELRLNNVSAEIETYRKSQPLPQAKIFKTAYSGNYDLLLLIEQVAKFSIDNRVTNSVIKMGGKFKIQSYDLKSATYAWKDHGNSNCNLSVDLSLKAFTDKLLESLDINPTYLAANEDDQFSQEVVKSYDYNKDRALYNDLLRQLETQKKKTRQLLFQVERLKTKLERSSNSYQNLALSKTER